MAWTQDCICYTVWKPELNWTSCIKWEVCKIHAWGRHTNAVVLITWKPRLLRRQHSHSRAPRLVSRLRQTLKALLMLLLFLWHLLLSASFPDSSTTCHSWITSLPQIRSCKILCFVSCGYNDCLCSEDHKVCIGSPSHLSPFFFIIIISPFWFPGTSTTLTWLKISIFIYMPP